MKMYIKAEDFVGILRDYYSEMLWQDVKVKYECFYGDGQNGHPIPIVNFLCETERVIYNNKATLTTELSQDDIQEAFSKILEEYDIKNIAIETYEPDCNSDSFDFFGVELSLEEKQKRMQLEQ